MKAVVLEVRGDEAAILTMDGTVRRVRGHYRVGQEMEYAPPARFSYLRWIAAVLVAAILLTASAGMWIGNNYVACAEVSLDVNPSIVYTLNRRSRVLSVAAVNEDAADIVAAIGPDGMRFMPIEDAVERTLDVLEDAGYLDAAAENYVLAGVSADDTGIRDDLAGRVEAVMARPRAGAGSVTCQIERTDRAAARQAHEKGMSPGRYAAWQAVRDERGPEDFAEMPVREIMGHAEPGAPKEKRKSSAADERPEAGKTVPANREDKTVDADHPGDVPAGKTESPEPANDNSEQFGEKAPRDGDETPSEAGAEPTEGASEAPLSGAGAEPSEGTSEAPSAGERAAEGPDKAEPPQESREKKAESPAKAEDSPEKQPHEDSKNPGGGKPASRDSGRSQKSQRGERSGGGERGGGPGGRR